MKKSLIAVAVAAALPAAAFAQSSVTLYGIVDAALVQINDGTNSALKVESAGMTASRWGIRGSESLGGGLNAVFTLESGLKADTGAASGATEFFNRRAVVGLNGGFGEVRLGRDYTPLFKAIGTWDSMGYSYFGNLLSWSLPSPLGAGATGGSAAYGSTNSGAARYNNAIFYDTPNMGGLTASLAYSLGEVAGNGSANRGMGLSVSYAAGPIGVALGYESTNDALGNNFVKSTGLGGSYNFGAFKVTAGWLKADRATATDVTAWSLGASGQIGAGTLMAQYQRQTVETNARGNTISVAYNYPMSKRTSIYGTFGQTANSNGGTFNLRAGDGQTAPVGANVTVRGIGVGVSHNF